MVTPSYGKNVTSPEKSRSLSTFSSPVMIGTPSRTSSGHQAFVNSSDRSLIGRRHNAKQVDWTTHPWLGGLSWSPKFDQWISWFHAAFHYVSTIFAVGPIVPREPYREAGDTISSYPGVVHSILLARPIVSHPAPESRSSSAARTSSVVSMGPIVPRHSSQEAVRTATRIDLRGTRANKRPAFKNGLNRRLLGDVETSAISFWSNTSEYVHEQLKVATSAFESFWNWNSSISAKEQEENISRTSRKTRSQTRQRKRAKSTGNEIPATSFFDFLSSYYNYLLGLILSFFSWSGEGVKNAFGQAWQACGLPCAMGAIAYNWSWLLLYLPYLLALYAAYLIVTLVTEECILPCLRKWEAFVSFMQGTAPSLSLRLALGRPSRYTNQWCGVLSANSYSREHFDDYIKHGKCSKGKPLDLIVTRDNVQFTRLHGKALRTKSGARGAYVKYDTVVASTSRSQKAEIERNGCRLHLCTSRNCADLVGGPAFHVMAYSTIPQDLELDLTDLRTLTTSLRWMLCCNMCCQGFFYGWHRCIFASCRCCFRWCRRHSGVKPIAPDDSCTESENEAIPCDARYIKMRLPQGLANLSDSCCSELAGGEPVQMLNEDAAHSSGAAQQNEDGA